MMPKISKAPQVHGGRGFAVALAILSVWLVAAPAGAQTFRALPSEPHIIRPPAAGIFRSTPMSPGDQIQNQLFRDELQTRQRQLEDRGAGVEALRNQRRLNSLGSLGQ